jgi:hypothetical protein
MPVIEVMERLLEVCFYAAAAALVGAAGGYLTSSRATRQERGTGEAHLAAAMTLRRWGLAAAATLVLLALVRLAVRTAADAGRFPSVDAMAGVVSGTTWGNGWWAQLYVALLAVAGLLIAGRRVRQGWSLATAAALGVAYTLPMTGNGGAAVFDRGLLLVAALHALFAGLLASAPMTLLAMTARGAALVHAAGWTRWLAVGGLVLTVAALALVGDRLGPDGTGVWVLVLKAAMLAVAATLALARPRVALAATGAALVLTALL